MLLQTRIEAFVKLGEFLSQFSQEQIVQKNNIIHNDLFFDAFKMQIKRAKEFNGWFTEDNVLFSLESWAKQLTNDNLSSWISNRQLQNSNKTIAVIMAGNIPLVGFHDFLSVLIAGNSVLVKQSSNDKHLLPLIAKYLEYVAPDFKGKISFTEDKLENFDAVIATGSNNTARYFDYYFGKYPSIIRKSRNSAAILTGNETKEELIALGEDVFRYFGLGCRSVSKLFVPKGYDFNQFFGGMYPYHHVINYKKYENNYNYNKTVYLMSEFDLLENGFLMIKEDASYASPIATVFYEYYEDITELKEKLNQETELIQCVVGNSTENSIPFGQTQQPSLTDYADGVDTLEFLSSL